MAGLRLSIPKYLQYIIVILKTTVSCIANQRAAELTLLFITLPIVSLIKCAQQMQKTNFIFRHCQWDIKTLANKLKLWINWQYNTGVVSALRFGSLSVSSPCFMFHALCFTVLPACIPAYIPSITQPLNYICSTSGLSAFPSALLCITNSLLLTRRVYCWEPKEVRQVWSCLDGHFLRKLQAAIPEVT